MVQKTDRPASFPIWGTSLRSLSFPRWHWDSKCSHHRPGVACMVGGESVLPDVVLLRCCYVCPQRFSFSTLGFNFLKSSNLPSYPLLSVQLSGIADTHIIVQQAIPSSHRFFYIKIETMSQLCANTSFSSSPALAGTGTPDFMNLPPLRTSWVEFWRVFPLFFLPVVKYTQQKIDHLSIFSAQWKGHQVHSSLVQPSPSCISIFFLPETWGSTGLRLTSPLPQPLTTTTLLFCLYRFVTLQT